MASTPALIRKRRCTTNPPGTTKRAETSKELLKTQESRWQPDRAPQVDKAKRHTLKKRMSPEQAEIRGLALPEHKDAPRLFRCSRPRRLPTCRCSIRVACSNR